MKKVLLPLLLLFAVCLSAQKISQLPTVTNTGSDTLKPTDVFPVVHDSATSKVTYGTLKTLFRGATGATGTTGLIGATGIQGITGPSGAFNDTFTNPIEFSHPITVAGGIILSGPVGPTNPDTAIGKITIGPSGNLNIDTNCYPTCSGVLDSIKSIAWLNGGNTALDSVKRLFGTQDSAELQIITYGQVALQISALGDIGIPYSYSGFGFVYERKEPFVAFSIGTVGQGSTLYADSFNIHMGSKNNFATDSNMKFEIQNSHSGGDGLYGMYFETKFGSGGSARDVWPLSPGSPGYALTYGSGGLTENMSWQPVISAATNGLTGISGTVYLGGTITQNTSINRYFSGDTMTFISTDSFVVGYGQHLHGFGFSDNLGTKVGIADLSPFGGCSSTALMGQILVDHVIFIDTNKIKLDHKSIEISGQLKYFNGSPALGDILTSDATGVANWQGMATGATGGEPGTPYLGEEYYDTTLSKFKKWNGSAWAVITSTP